MLSYLPLILSFSTFSAIVSFFYFWPKYLLLGMLRVTFLVSGFRVRHKWVGDPKKYAWGRCRLCYAERKPHGHLRRHYHHQHRHHHAPCDTIVMLHGFTASKDVWLPVCKRIPRHFRLIVIDLPGHGGSSKQRNPTFESSVDAIEELLHHLGVKDCTLVGFSLGGPLSAVIAKRLPHVVSKLVLVAPAVRPPVFSEFWEMLESGKCVFLTRSTEEVRLMFKWIRYKTMNVSKYFLRGLAAIRSSNYDYYQLMYEDLFTEENIRVLERVGPSLTVPTFLVFGENDLVIDKSAGDYLRDILSSSFREVEYLPECGHSVTMEQPALLAALLVKWQSVH